MAEFTIHDKKAQKLIKKFLKNAKEFERHGKRYAAAMSVWVFQDIMDHFDKEEGPEGMWKQWTTAYKKQRTNRLTAKQKRKRGKRFAILQDSGALRKAFLPVESPSLAGSRSTSDGILWFNPAKTASGYPYAWGHDTGDGKLPKRTFMWLSNDAQNKIAEGTLEFIIRG